MFGKAQEGSGGSEVESELTTEPKRARPEIKLCCDSRLHPATTLAHSRCKNDEEKCIDGSGKISGSRPLALDEAK